MREFMNRLEKLGEEDVFIDILDKVSSKLVLITALVGVPFFIVLLLQFSRLFF